MSKAPTRIQQVSLALSAVLLCSLAVPPDAQAYLDPGTGSAVVQMVLAGVMGAIFVIKIYWHKLMGLFSGSADDKAQTTPDASVVGNDDE